MSRAFSASIVIAAVLLCLLACAGAADAAYAGRLQARRVGGQLQAAATQGVAQTSGAEAQIEPMTATCKSGPYQLTNVQVAAKATLKLTLESCTGQNVQTSLAGVTASVLNSRKVRVKTFVNGEATFFNADKTSCYTRAVGYWSRPTKYSGSVELEVTCLEKKDPCTVNLAWAADCDDE